MIGSLIIVLLGVAMFLEILLPDASRNPNIRLSSYISVGAILIIPPFFVLLGSYLQRRNGKPWLVAIPIIAGLSNLFYVVINIGFTFLFIPDKLGQFEVLAYTAALIGTLVVSVLNTATGNKLGRKP